MVSRSKEIALAALIGTPLLIGVIEGVLWLVGVQPSPRVLFDDQSCYAAFEASTHLYRTKNGLEHDLWLDSNGFRVDGAIARGEKIVPPPRCRVLALGDSFTEGFFVTADETWPAQLESRLRERGYDVRVDNGGFRSLSIVEHRFAALTRWHALQHDLVVLEHTMNDLEELVEARRKGCVPPRLRFVERWRIFRLAQEAAARFPFAGAKGARRSGSSTKEECDAAKAEYLEQLLDVATSLRNEGRRFLFVQMEPFGCSGYGDLKWAQYSHLWDEYRAGVQRALVREGASYVDVTDELRVPGRSLLPADTHPSATAYAAMARRIADHIESSGILDDCRASDIR